MIAALAVAAGAASARADDATGLYNAYWAGLPAGQIRLSLRDGPGVYRAEIAIGTEGMARLVSRFRGGAVSEGRLAAGRAEPMRYDALYDLRKHHDRRLSLRFVERGGARFAERAAGDTSTKPPLAAELRKNVLDPLSVVAAIRQQLRSGNRSGFTIPVYDGARRFDALVRVLPKEKPGEPVLRLALNLHPIAGFKGETSDDGDPDSAPRPVTLVVTDDARLMPVSMTVSIAYLPLVVELARWCTAAAPCGG